MPVTWNSVPFSLSQLPTNVFGGPYREFFQGMLRLFYLFPFSFTPGASVGDTLIWLKCNAYKQSSTGKDYGYAVLRFLRASGLVCKRNGERKFEKYVVKLYREGASYQAVVKAFYGFRAFASISGWKLWKDESPELLLRGYKRWHASVKKPVVRKMPLSLGDMRLLGKRVNRAAPMK
jgi:hypothetical protein